MTIKGFTLIEVMISLFIGSLILGGTMFIYLSMKINTKSTMTLNELQESGRLAMTVMQQDIELVGFWGTFYERSFRLDNTTSIANPAGDCFSNINNASFPDLTSQSSFQFINATTAQSTIELECVNNPLSGSDILQVKFLHGQQVSIGSENNASQQDKNYFIAEPNQAHFTNTILSTSKLHVNATVWPYNHHVYYISEQTYKVNNNNLTVPVLMRKRLVGDRITTETILEGVENMRFMFGLDTKNDGRVDSYKSIHDMALNRWGDHENILTIQMFLLVRTLQPDATLKLKNQKYVLGEGLHKRELLFTDSYRRAVFTTTIRLHNMGISSWHI